MRDEMAELQERVDFAERLLAKRALNRIDAMNGTVSDPDHRALDPVSWLWSKSSIGQSIADAIRHNSGASEGAAARRELEQMRADLDQLRAELEDVHTQLLETHERLDFAERLLAKPADGQTGRGVR